MEAWELRERYLKAGMNEAGGNAKGKVQKAEPAGEKVFLSAKEYLDSVADQGPWAEVAVDAEEEALLAELQKEEAEEDQETGRQGDKEGQEARNPNDESNPKLEIRNGQIAHCFGHSNFGFESSFEFRVSGFGYLASDL